MSTKARILVVDDDEIVCRSCSRILEEHRVFTTLRPREAVKMLAEAPYDLVLLDMMMPEMDGLELLRHITETYPQTDVVMVTGYSTIETAVQAIKLGAEDYVRKPVTPDSLLAVVDQILDKRLLRAEDIQVHNELHTRRALHNIVGGSQSMQAVYQLVAKVAPTSTTVLIQGESGTGKELVAKAIHYNSKRKDGPFVPVDCAGMSETLLESELFGHAKGAFTGAVTARQGLLESANGGTLFLDEIGNLPLSTQAKVLRVLQEREYRQVGDNTLRKLDARVLTATNKDIQAMVQEGTYREDLLFRISVFQIKVPPLRERLEDVPALAYLFLNRSSAAQGSRTRRISAEAMNLLLSARWPGNVRELESAIETGAVLAEGKTILPEHLPSYLQGPAGDPIPLSADELNQARKKARGEAVATIERAFLSSALTRNGWNITRAAQDVSMQRSNFHALVSKHGLRKPTYPRGADDALTGAEDS